MPTFVFAVLLIPPFNVLSNYFLCFTQFGGSSYCYNFDKIWPTAPLSFSCVPWPLNCHTVLLVSLHANLSFVYHQVAERMLNINALLYALKNEIAKKDKDTKKRKVRKTKIFFGLSMYPRYTV